jgi:hypothetical protein
VHTLNPLKGWPSPHALDFSASFNTTQLAAISGNVAFSGRVVHLDDNGAYKFGVANRQMALFLFNNSDDPDVSNDGGNPASDATAWVPIKPSGKMMALPATGAYELETTEYDSSQTYLPNQTLTAATGTTLATAGVLTNRAENGDIATPYTHAVCGVVSRGEYTNSFGRSVLAFWPVYLPTAGALSN